MPDFTFCQIMLLIVVFLANVVEAVTGFGGTIIAVTIGANFYPIDTLIVPALAPLHILLSAYLTFRYYKYIDHNELWKRILPVVGLGIPLGLLATRYVKGNALPLCYGIFVFSIAIFELVRIYLARNAPADAKPAGITLAKGAPWLFAGGIIHGIYLSGGPLIVYYANKALPDKTRFRSTMSAMWLILNIAVFMDMIHRGCVTRATLTQSAILFPTLIIGIIAGDLLHKRIPEKAFRIFIFVLLIIGGASLALKSF